MHGQVGNDRDYGDYGDDIPPSVVFCREPAELENLQVSRGSISCHMKPIQTHSYRRRELSNGYVIMVHDGMSDEDAVSVFLLGLKIANNQGSPGLPAR